LVIGAEGEFHRCTSAGERLSSNPLPSAKRKECRIEIGDMPTREERLSRLSFAGTVSEKGVRTGYLRLALDTLLNAGWMKQL